MVTQSDFEKGQRQNKGGVVGGAVDHMTVEQSLYKVFEYLSIWLKKKLSLFEY